MQLSAIVNLIVSEGQNTLHPAAVVPYYKHFIQYNHICGSSFSTDSEQVHVIYQNNETIQIFFLAVISLITKSCFFKKAH